MVNLSYKNDQDSDERLNPAELQNLEQQSTFNRDFDSMTSDENYRKSADDSQENNNIKKLEDEAGWKTTADGSASQKTDWKVRLKKKGPMGAIIALLLGGGAGLSFIFAPGMVAIHLTEVLTEDLNDQVAAADIRTDHVLRTKIKNMSKSIGICSNSINIRCKFSSMNKYQVNQFRKAGFELTCEKGPCDRVAFNRLTSIRLPNGKEINNPNALLGRAATDPEIAQGLKKAFNPVYRMMADTVANSRFAKFGGKNNQFIGKKRAEMHKALLSASEKRATDIGKLSKSEKDGKTVYTDSDGNVIDIRNEAEYERHNKAVDRLNNSGGMGRKATSALRGASVIGATDLWCTGYGLYRGVSTGAKLLRSEALARLATAHHSAVQAAKAEGNTGETDAHAITPETMDFIGTMLTETDTRKEIYDPGDDEAKRKIPNPNYGKSAMDSVFLKTSMHGDVPDIKAESTQYMVGGGAVGEFADFARQFSQEKPSYCKIVQNNFVRATVAIGSLVLGAGTGGTTLVLSAAGSVAAGFAVSYLEAMLTDMVAGDIVTSATKATQYGDALFSGTGVLLGSIAKARGLRPLTEDNINGYMDTSREVTAKNTNLETIAAKATPFDIHNQYSFLGSLTRSLTPAYIQGTSTIATVSQSIPSIYQIAGAAITGKSTAKALAGNPKRFDICDDQDYKKLKIKADVACNVRYGLSNKELKLDPEAVLDFMINNKHVSEEGEPLSSKYSDYLEYCTEPEYGIFSSAGEEGESTFGNYEQCVEDGPGDIYNYFRVYTLDKSIVDSMDSEPVTSTASSGNGAQFKIGTFNIYYSSQGVKNWEKRLDRSMDVIATNDLDIVGLQEVRKNQWEGIKSQEGLGDTYDIYPDKYIGVYGDTNPIIWNKNKFSLIKGEYLASERSEPKVGINEKSRIKVKLQDNATGQQFYVINMHQQHGDGDSAKKARYDDSLLLKKQVESLTDAPVFLTGDFNSGLKRIKAQGVYQGKVENLTYCILTDNNLLWNAYDARDNESGKCPKETIKTDDGGHDPSPVDHIFMSTNVQIQKGGTGLENNGVWRALKRKNGSDVHDTVMASVIIPGSSDTTSSGEATTSGGLAWPLGKKAWENNNNLFLKGHISTGTAWGSDMSFGVRGDKGGGIASDLGTPTGTPVYAMLGGTVKSVSLCGSGDGVGIRSVVGGKNIDIAYMHGNKQKFKVGDNVKAGDHIMDVALIGCSVFGAHLHVGMSYDGKYICPQDIFVAMAKKQSINWGSLPSKTSGGCARSL